MTNRMKRQFWASQSPPELVVVHLAVFQGVALQLVSVLQPAATKIKVDTSNGSSRRHIDPVPGLNFLTGQILLTRPGLPDPAVVLWNPSPRGPLGRGRPHLGRQPGQPLPAPPRGHAPARLDHGHRPQRAPTVHLDPPRRHRPALTAPVGPAATTGALPAQGVALRRCPAAPGALACRPSLTRSGGVRRPRPPAWGV